MGDAEGYFFQEADTDLAQGAAAVIPISDVYEVGVAVDTVDIVEDDEMGRKAAFEFDVVLFMQVGVVDVKEGRAAPGYSCFQVIKEIWDIGADEIRATGFDAVAEELTDHAVEFAVIDGGPEGIFGTGAKAAGEEVEIGSEVVGEGEEPELVGGADIEDAFEAQCAGCFVDAGGRIEMSRSHCGFAIGV
jgi:hypothetical protein